MLTCAVSANFLRGQLTWMRESGFDVTVVSSDGQELRTICEAEGVAWAPLHMEREMSPLADIVSLVRLTRLLSKLKPHVVNSGTPKAGLLGMLAAALTRTPARLYVVRGLRLETATGVKRLILSVAERIACVLAHRVICVSPSLRVACIRHGVVRPDKAVVIGEGSSNGVNVCRFPPAGSPAANRCRRKWRADLGLPMDAFVYGFVGRITRDKGVPDLLDAFDQVSQQRPDAWLLLVGPIEQGDAIPAACRLRIEQGERIIATGFLQDVDTVYAAMDVLVHPSLREGFANAPCEAAATGLPAIGREVTGVVDPILHNRTGKIVPALGSRPLARAMQAYCDNRGEARRHGRAGRERMETRFPPKRIWQGLLELYLELLGQGSDTVKSIKPLSVRKAASNAA